MLTLRIWISNSRQQGCIGVLGPTGEPLIYYSFRVFVRPESEKKFLLVASSIYHVPVMLSVQHNFFLKDAS